MINKTQEQFIIDVQNQITQFIYRNSLQSIDVLIKFLQEVSTIGNMNWHISENKEKLNSVFIALTEEIKNYTLADGDFRSYVCLKMTTIIFTVYKDELFSTYFNRGYNIDPNSVVGSLSDTYSTQLPQNTNFPGVDNTANEFIPISPNLRLIPDILYKNSD